MNHGTPTGHFCTIGIKLGDILKTSTGNLYEVRFGKYFDGEKEVGPTWIAAPEPALPYDPIPLETLLGGGDDVLVIGNTKDTPELIL